MKKEKCTVLVGTDPFETRVVVLKGDVLDQYFIERRERGQLLGNVYSARVARVLPGIRAAFIDTGLERAAFLPATQVVSEEFMDAAGRRQDSPKNGEKRKKRRRRGVALIEKSIRKGEEIVVQILSVPGWQKGPKVTTYISIPGHYLVFMPTVKGLGVSRKIQRQKERVRLRKIGESLMKDIEGGFIVRSASEGAEKEKIVHEAKWLYGRWKESIARNKGKKPPYLLIPELSLAERILRELRDEDIKEIIVDDFDTVQRIKNFAGNTDMEFRDKIRSWNKEEDMFEALGVEEKIERSFARKIALGSGGHIVIDQAEALTAIDVNTGSFTGAKDPMQTVLTTNLEAVREIAYQLRLRHIGGLIILDLIDMEKDDHKEAVYGELVKQVRKDKAKVSVRRISDMGLIEMTREHYGPRVIDMLQEKCWYCDGTGNILARDAISGKMLRAMIRTLKANPSDLSVTAHQSMVLRMESDFGKYLKNLENKYHVKINFDPKIDVHIEYFNISQLS